MSGNDRKLLLAIDTHAIIHRAYHAYPQTLTTADGAPINAVYGFTSMLLDVMARYEPEYIICATDAKGKTFRNDIFKEYKAHRKPIDQELIDQFDSVEEVINTFNIPLLKVQGYEADDILGTLAKKVSEGKWKHEDVDIIIVSGDKDLFQLVGDRVIVSLPAGSFSNLKSYNSTEVYKKMGVYPNQIIDYKALVGDPSDNIPGIKGLGPKTVVKLMDSYGSLDGIYEHLEDQKGALLKRLQEGVKEAEMSKTLATIADDVDIDVTLEQSRLHEYDREEVINLFSRFGFRSLLKKLPGQSAQPEKAVGGQMGLFSPNNVTESSSEDISIQSLEKSTYLSKIKENSEKIGVLHRVEGGGSSYVSSFVDKDGVKFYCEESLNLDEILSAILGVRCETYFSGWEFFVSDWRLNGARFSSGWREAVETVVHDVNLVEHLLDAGSDCNDLDGLIYKRVGTQVGNSWGLLNQKFWDVVEQQQKELVEYFDSEELEDIRSGGAIDDPTELVREELKTAVVLADLEHRGVRVDADELKSLHEDISSQIAETEKAIYESVGFEFNVGSPKQLSEVLFDQLNLGALAGIKGRSTREEVLQKLLGAHPVIELILSYRKLSKLHGTYILPYMSILQERGGDRICTDMQQTGTSSGRFSSHEPNLQNLPADEKFGQMIRKIFIPTEGMKMVAVDYSQIELRLTAHLSKDSGLLKAYADNLDIHAFTASKIFNKLISEIGKDQRKVGKTVNFAVLYGQGKYGLSAWLGVKPDKADQYIRNYFDSYPGVKSFMNRLRQDAINDGYVSTMLGRRRFIGDADSESRKAQQSAMREAINMPIQGSAADVMKLAMIEIYEELLCEKYKDKAFILLQIHDEFLFECEESIVDEFTADVVKIMEGVVKLDVDMVASAETGDNMAEVK